MRPGIVLAGLAAVAPLTPQRAWIERLALLVPGPAATRWLLVADLVCLIAVGLRSRHPVAGAAVMIAVGFVALNVVGMAVTDFYLGLAAFHFGVAIATTVLAPSRRWLGVTVFLLAALLGITT
ncbi:MAG: hypothetical protein DMD81_12215 [Candidatus Rokuibacteriota bacterium]|nr:MAG: hypothetical protein DMD81_12215 [Candidatus Rokubacteria bacterium]